MGELSYTAAPVRVRPDLEEGHRRSWQSIGRPGTWWNGPQRVAIAAESRRAADCRPCRRENEGAAGPARFHQAHDSLDALPGPVVDLVHRVRNMPGRLDRAWFDEIMGQGLDAAAYVEAVAVAARTIDIDVFCRGIGTAQHALPVPAAGEPSRRMPVGARQEGAWVTMVSASLARDSRPGLYPAGRVPNIGRALSLVPDETASVSDLLRVQYLPIDRVSDFGFDPGRALSRPQMELLAGRVSALNRCYY